MYDRLWVVQGALPRHQLVVPLLAAPQSQQVRPQHSLSIHAYVLFKKNRHSINAIDSNAMMNSMMMRSASLAQLPVGDVRRAAQPGEQDMHRSELLDARRQLAATLLRVQRVLPRAHQESTVLLPQSHSARRGHLALLREQGSTRLFL